MTERWTYVNGEWVTDDKAFISCYDAHFMFGDAVFEMHRTFRHRHFLLNEHIERLFVSMRAMQIPQTKRFLDVKLLCDEALERNRFDADEEYRFLINVSRGPLGIYREVFELSRGDRWDEPTWIVNVWPLSKTTRALARFYDAPADARITVQRQVPAQFIDPKVKNRSRAHYMLADLEMRRLPEDVQRRAMPLLLDDQGFVCESTGANFVVVKDGKLCVPERRNMLRGCSMQFILEELAPRLHLEVVERNMEPYDVLTADEAFFTGTFYNLIPCDSLNGVRFGTPFVDGNNMGGVTRRIVDAWNSHLEATGMVEPGFDFVRQIRGWAGQVVDG